MIDANTPVLVGVGQYTVRDEPLDALSTPMDLMERAAHAAAKDAHAPKRWLEDIDTLVAVKSFREPMRNSPAVLNLAPHSGVLAVFRAFSTLSPPAACGPFTVPTGGPPPQLVASNKALQMYGTHYRY